MCMRKAKQSFSVKIVYALQKNILRCIKLEKDSSEQNEWKAIIV